MNKFFLVFIIALFQYHLTAEITAAENIDNKNNSFLIDTKCSKCHTIKRVFIHARSEEEWLNVIEKMTKKVPGWISPEDAKQIFNEITKNWQDRVKELTAERKDFDDNKLLFLDRCTMCHPVNRILKENKSSEEWKETVERMRSEAGDFITEEDANRIGMFLSKRSETLKEDAGSDLFVSKCLACHPPGEKLLLEKHNRKDWEKIVKDRQQYAKNATPRIIIGNEEAALIVELLVKTQGLE